MAGTGELLSSFVVFVVYLACALAVDALALPRGRLARRPAWALAVALATLAWLFIAWFAISWRPVFASVAALSSLVIVVLISDYKYRNTQEPLSFVDFALIPQIWRHPLLYQAQFLHHPASWAALVGVFAFCVLWFVFLEPESILPVENRLAWIVASQLVTPILAGWLLFGPIPQRLIVRIHALLMPTDSARDVSRFGLITSLLLGVIAWRHRISASRLWPPLIAAPAEAAPVVIAVQSESFVDLRLSGLRDLDLPALAQARAKAMAYGRLTVPVQGAWTLRSEFSFLTGRDLDTYGLDSLHPYLRLDHAPRTIAHQFRDAGFETVFAHPFDIRFFNRDRAMPVLGFDRLVHERDFPGVTREGYFVPDMALAEHVLSLAAASERPIFCFAATMENHNPWDHRRLPHIGSPSERYMYHLRNADRMIARLIQGLETIGRPAVFAFYGDHVPTIKSLAYPFPDPRTDYFVMGLRDGAWLRGGERNLALHELADVILSVLAEVAKPPVGARETQKAGE